MKCQRCGCISTLPQLFVGEYGEMFCPACAAKRALRQARVSYGVMFVLIVGDLLRGWWMTGEPGYWGRSFGSFFVVTFLMIVLHEFSHAAAAWLLRGRVFGIHLGFGNPLLQTWLGSFYVGLSLIPAGGLCFCGFPTKGAIRLRFGLMVLAGPLVHLLAIGLWIALLRAGVLADRTAWFAGWHIMFLVVNVLLLVVNLWPLTKARTPIGIAPSDGGQLWLLLTGKLTADLLHERFYIGAATFALYQKRDENALAQTQEGLAIFPKSDLLQNIYGYMLFRSNDFAGAMPIWASQLQAAEMDAESESAPSEGGDNQPPFDAQKVMIEAFAYNNYAWGLLMQRLGLEEIAVANRYAEKAFAMLPWVPAIRGTLGAAMIERGDYQAGIDMVQTAAAEHKREQMPAAKQNYASNLAIIGLGYQRLGSHAQAAEYLAQAQAIAPEEMAVKLAAQEIGV